ncbi:MAG: hypothetical protein ABJH07_08385 [Sedimentitalea sp.]|uniref:hypothetical protein n=1 Tax=Sedimentitalea sp. TaxID=2048915 RepID=UPI003265714A
MMGQKICYVESALLIINWKVSIMPPNFVESEDIDGCDVDFALEEQTRNADLPETFGGVGSAEEELDGCDIDFEAELQTADVDLPLTTGGVG